MRSFGPSFLIQNTVELDGCFDTKGLELVGGAGLGGSRSGHGGEQERRQRNGRRAESVPKCHAGLLMVIITPRI
jgi:hypothetical protein